MAKNIVSTLEDENAPPGAILVRYKGGAGSGFHNHSGLPGKWGGSRARGSAGGPPKDGKKKISKKPAAKPKKKVVAAKPEPKAQSIDEAYANISSYPEAESIQAYTADWYFDINDNLRKGRKSDAETQKMINDLDTALEKSSRMPSDALSYRGVDGLNLRIGQTVTDKAFVSTSLNKSKAAEFTTSGTMLEIKVPKGSKAMYLNSLSDYKDEKELLLGRGSSFKITGSRTETISRVGPFNKSVNVTVYEAEYVQ